MSVVGIRYSRERNCISFYIDELSDDFKLRIKNQLSGIFNGFSETIEIPTLYTLSFTLKSFLDRYDSKSDDIKKGMIGELLSHVLINIYLDELESLSILKNKEERSIKKGFDIIYFNRNTDCLWYAEVKSGASENGEYNSTEYNKVLLNRSRTGIKEIFDSGRSSLWESAMIDVKLMIEEGVNRKKLRDLLSSEIHSLDHNEKKHVILISVLYHALTDEFEFNSLLDFYAETTSTDTFRDSVVISIQKRTFEAVANFLHQESLATS